LDADIGGYIHMEGREVFRRAVRVMIDSGRRAMDRAGVRPDDIALVVPHQANIRIIESANAKLGLPMERTALVLEQTGNTSSASIPLALVDAIENNRLSPGDLIMFVGFGAGMTWASAILRWDPY
jgi:3-oxoacyl-[acyl-carrier-protein] synthase-3